MIVARPRPAKKRPTIRTPVWRPIVAVTDRSSRRAASIPGDRRVRRHPRLAKPRAYLGDREQRGRREDDPPRDTHHDGYGPFPSVALRAAMSVTDSRAGALWVAGCAEPRVYV